MSDENQKPVFECRSRGVKGAVWVRDKKTDDGREYVEFSIQITKSYKDKDGNWHTTSNYFVNDLPYLELVARRCFAYTALHETASDIEY